MAYLIGLVTPEEAKILESRGWELEKPPSDFEPDEKYDGHKMVLVYVDSNLFDVMNGPDWEK